MFENFIKEFLTNKKNIELVKTINPLGIVKAVMKGLDLCTKDAANVTLGLIKHTNHVQDQDLEKYLEGIPLSGPRDAGQFPVPNRLKKDKPNIDEISPLRGEPEFQKHYFPPEKHRKMSGEFPYDDASVRWSRARGTTPRSGRQT